MAVTGTRSVAEMTLMSDGNWGTISRSPRYSATSPCTEIWAVTVRPSGSSSPSYTSCHSSKVMVPVPSSRVYFVPLANGSTSAISLSACTTWPTSSTVIWPIATVFFGSSTLPTADTPAAVCGTTSNSPLYSATSPSTRSTAPGTNNAGSGRASYTSCHRSSVTIPVLSSRIPLNPAEKGRSDLSTPSTSTIWPWSPVVRSPSCRWFTTLSAAPDTATSEGSSGTISSSP